MPGRRLLISLSHDERFRSLLMESPATRELVSRYIAGEGIDEVLATIADQNRKGLAVGIDLLREAAGCPAEAASAAAAYLEVLRRLDEHGLALGADLSVKLDALGLIGPAPHPAGALDALRRVCRTADNYGCTVTLDMGSADAVERVLAVAHELRQDHPAVGVVLWAMLRRTEQDCRELAARGVRVRLSKGASRAPAGQAFTEAHEVDLSFVRCLRVLMDSPAHPTVASHDPRLIEIALDLARRARRSKASYEFQMLLGVRPLEQRRLADVGETMRCQVPFGPDWYGYFLRRIAERPGSAALYARSLVSRR